MDYAVIAVLTVLGIWAILWRDRIHFALHFKYHYPSVSAELCSVSLHPRKYSIWTDRVKYSVLEFENVIHGSAGSNPASSSSLE